MTQSHGTQDLNGGRVELLPCPFCGGVNTYVAADEVGSGGQWVAPIHVGCSDCRVDMAQHDYIDDAIAAWNLRSEPSEPVAHPDDIAVDRFGAAMKSKMKWERDVKSRKGWEDHDACPAPYLARLLIEHIAKGNAGTFEDVANFAMMLHQRGDDPSVLRAALYASPNPGAER